jgi:hypothetical protein
MNENKLRLAIRKELRKLNEVSSAELASQGFNAAAASPEQIMYAVEIISAALAGTVLLKAWSPIQSYIKSALFKQKA